MKKIVPVDAILIPDAAKRVFQGQIFDVYQWPQQLFDGHTATFEMLKRPDTALGIGIVDGKILVINNIQPHRGDKLSLPGGRADKPGQTILEAVQREVREETGYQFAHWKLIDVSQPQRKIEWFVHLFIAWDATGTSEPKPDAGEQIKVQLLSLEQVKQLGRNRIGFMGESAHIFEHLHSLDDLVNLPEFTGQQINAG